jgi:CDP-diacylglycerol--glycerol-3-phosphate 3-phosphatidyltransferase
MFLLTAIILWLDSFDGYLARKLKQSSDFGALFDIVGDRIVENAYWIYFASLGMISIWVPIFVLARGFITDAIRSAAFAKGKTPFGEKTMLNSKWAKFLVSSRFSRLFYGASKLMAFCFLVGLMTLKSAIITFDLPLSANIVDALLISGNILSILVTLICLIRGIPVVWDGWRYIAVQG